MNEQSKDSLDNIGPIMPWLIASWLISWDCGDWSGRHRVLTFNSKFKNIGSGEGLNRKTGEVRSWIGCKQLRRGRLKPWMEERMKHNVALLYDLKGVE
jgi:hypothetical protein